MLSDRARSRTSVALLAAGTVTGVAMAAGPVFVVREEIQRRGEYVEGAALVLPALASAVVALLVSLAAWHRTFARQDPQRTRARNRQLAYLAALTPLTALLLATAWESLASSAQYPVSAVVVLPLVPGVLGSVLGILVSALSDRKPLQIMGTGLSGLGLLVTVALDPAFFGWVFLCACLFMTSRTLRLHAQTTRATKT